MDFMSFFTPAVLAANYMEVASNRIPYLGEGLFPAEKKAGLDLAWIKGSKGLPISLMPSAFDAQATYRDRLGVEKVETEMPFFREGFKIKEKDRQELMRALDSKDPYAAAIIRRVFDDNAQLIEGAMVAAERERMQLLFPVGGDLGISIQANGVDYTYNYDPSETWKGSNYFALQGGRLWSDATNANPFDDIETAKNAILERTGTTLTTAIMNRYTFNKLVAIKALKDRFMSTTGRAIAYLTPGELAKVFEDTEEVGIAVYDKQFKDESGTARKFVPNGYVALIPDGALGNTWYGTTPEEADGKNTTLVNTGVSLTVVPIDHPVNTNILASEIMLPSYERADEVALLKVL